MPGEILVPSHRPRLQAALRRLLGPAAATARFVPAAARARLVPAAGVPGPEDPAPSVALLDLLILFPQVDVGLRCQ